MVAPVKFVVENIVDLTNALIQPIFIQILTFGLQVFPVILSFWFNADRYADSSLFQNPLKPETYDFIVVGGGCAGSIVANRLSRKYNVLLLELGGEVNPVQYIPTFAQFLANYEEVDYSFRSVPQKYFDSHVNRQVALSAGKGLGGSASINIMIYLRGHAKDYENWARIVKDDSWGWNGVLPYFKSFENFEIPGDNVYHGYQGELRVEAPDYIGTAREIVAAAGELGYPNVDMNGAPFTEGFDVIRYPIRNGVRQATYKAFIEPIRSRSTLTIRKFAQVTKILMKPGNIAYGVEYDRHGRMRVAYATREVIITAGSINTAKLLMLSGIGPRSHLESLNIPIKADLPVGMNMKDHLVSILGPFFINQPRSIDLNRDMTITEFIKWALFGRGRLSSSTAEAGGLIVSKLAKERGEGDWPDIQYLTQCVSFTADSIPAFAHSYGLKFDDVSSYFSPAVGRDSCVIGVIGARPLSKGFVKLGGSSPYDLPIIQPNYFSEEYDLKVMIEGVQTAMRLMENTTAFGKQFGSKFTETRYPGCENLEFRSEAYFECYIKRLTLSSYHYSGTAAIGSVVDTQLRVLNTTNLRVLDHSVAPEEVSTNTQAVTMMIAEKGSDMILRHWKQIELSESGKNGQSTWVRIEKTNANFLKLDPFSILGLKYKRRKRGVRRLNSTGQVVNNF